MYQSIDLSVSALHGRAGVLLPTHSDTKLSSSSFFPSVSLSLLLVFLHNLCVCVFVSRTHTQGLGYTHITQRGDWLEKFYRWWRPLLPEEGTDYFLVKWLF